MKLVRDRVPDLFPEHAYHKALPTERLVLLRLKLAEEVGEVLSAASPEATLEELADLAEVLDAVREAHGWSAAALAAARRAKNQARGAFEEGWVLE